MMRRALIIATLVAGAIGALAYLRDPAWLATSTSGLRRWETAADGTRFRWTGGHASFFVPSGWTGIELPLRATFDTPADWPIVATITIDDRPAERVTLTNPSWHRLALRLPPRGSRRVRRIDIRLDRTRDDNRGVQLGEIRQRFVSRSVVTQDKRLPFDD